MTGNLQDGPALLPALRRQNLSARVALILKRYILAERLEPGHRFPAERRLADWLNVSRTVLREALSQLIGEGILERPTPHSLCVATFDRGRLAAEVSVVGDEAAEVQDLIELRVVIELGAVEAIVERVTDEHLREIERWVVEGERRLAAREPFYRADARFHAALLRVLGNRVVDGLLPLIEENLRYDLVGDPHQLVQSGTAVDHRAVRQHREIYEALKRRDLEATRHWMLAHLTPYLRRARMPKRPRTSATDNRTPLTNAVDAERSFAGAQDDRMEDAPPPCHPECSEGPLSSPTARTR
ncbi:MAG: GntR family transcriptional regulator, transcriptional repressor for pyruvate dehydrogenase complex [Thermomicrobiales bacterium]|nr:GntR family transcriptional regulator, transcriptional repressor for pyruvate dehydrogenase complex [Thermomicrobiales bacterium]